MSSTGAHNALLVVSAIAVWVLAAHVIPRVSSLDRSTTMLAAALALASAPLYASFEFGTISIAVSALIFASWVWVDSERRGIAGIALGLAISLKVWPVLLLISLLVTRRFEVVRWSLATVLVIQVAGSILFGITPTEVFSALAGTSAKWLSFAGNGSASGTLVRLGIDPWLATIPLLILGAVTVWVVSSRHEAASYPIAIVVGLLVSPLAWEHYDVALLGVAALIVSVPHWPRMLAGAFLVLAMFGMQFRRIGPTDMYVVGWRTLVGRLLMLAAVVLSLHVLDLRRREQPARRAVSLQRASGATSEEHRGKSLSKVP
jgi:hypothetical protein